jgi:xanthine/uracil/vitamin C permease (AzgA family)
MSYIIFVQPVVLGAAGMDAGAVMVATCLSAAAATLLMGLLGVGWKPRMELVSTRSSRPL